MSRRNSHKTHPTAVTIASIPDDAGVRIRQERNRIYDEYRRELTVKQNSNSENYDRNILTLSSAGLALSLAFIKDIVPRNEMIAREMLLMSWFCFGLAIVATIVSFQLSQLAIQAALHDAVEYYLYEKEEFQSRECIWAKWTGRLNWTSGAFFFLAMLTTAIFVTQNFPTSPKHELVSTATQPTVSSFTGYPPAAQAEHRPTSQPASSDNPTSKEIKP